MMTLTVSRHGGIVRTRVRRHEGDAVGAVSSRGQSLSRRERRHDAVVDVEAEAARAAVDAASALCRDFQPSLLDADTVAKDDESPVTVADFAVQAVVSHVLSSALGDVRMIGEESVDDLRRPEFVSLSRRVVELVRRHVGASMSERDVFDSLALCSHDVPGGRYWALDPIDGTKGFLRGDQYAIALALIDDGDVVLGVLGCPNLANSDGSTGATFVAVPGRCRVHAGTRATVTRRRTGHTGRRGDGRVGRVWALGPRPSITDRGTSRSLCATVSH